jgi:hypothetical protein
MSEIRPVVVARGAKRVKSKGTTRPPRIPLRLRWALLTRKGVGVRMEAWCGCRGRAAVVGESFFAPQV